MRFFIVCVLIILVGCASHLPTRPQKSLQGELLTFLEQQPGQSQQRFSRYLVTKDWLRVEYDNPAAGYYLFDRQQQQLFHVDHHKREVEVFAKGMLALADEALPWQQQEEGESMALPRNGSLADADKRAKYYRFKLTQKPCLELVTVEQMLSEATQALSEYRTYLVRYRINQQPSDLSTEQQACYRAVLIQQPRLSFSHGFPLREWSASGYHRFLQDAKEFVKFEPQLFDLPGEYKVRQAEALVF